MAGLTGLPLGPKTGARGVNGGRLDLKVMALGRSWVVGAMGWLLLLKQSNNRITLDNTATMEMAFPLTGDS